MNASIKKLPALLLLAALFAACGPSIRSFTVTPLTITRNDSVKVSYSVRGKPTLLVHMEGEDDNGHSTPAVKSLELTLVAQKGTREQKRFVGVNVLPATAEDQIVFSTMLSGDTLVASGEKNAARWGDRFVVHSIAAEGGRRLTVWHAGQQTTLPANGNPVTTFDGTPYGGHWEIRSLLTEAEKKDHSLAPAVLKIKTVIRYQKPAHE
ncbi:MAG TPA: hypothetical protein VLD19_08195 [Chitinophagaceae bacterium]|nr:hypothetical protein [Chitinophagaceae bacterium]